MSRRDGDDWDGMPPPDPFADAVDEYQHAFGAARLPHLWLVDFALATRVLRMAVARGRPIRHYLISRLDSGWRGMPAKKDGLEVLQDLLRVYRRQFGADIWIYGLHPERIAPTLAAMRAAMACGKALTVDQAAEVTGTSPPPLGADR